MLSLYLTPFIISFALSLFLTLFLIKISAKLKIFFPAGKQYFYGNNISRIGGAAIIAAFLSAIFFTGNLEFDNLKWGMAICSVIILFFGFIDDIKKLSWKKQIFAQIIVAAVMIYSGLGVEYIANPFGGAEFRMDTAAYQIAGKQYYLFSSVFVLFLIVGFMNIVNWLDGLDGLAGGVGIIGFLTLFFLSISSLVNQPPIGIISIAAAGAILGFLLFNFYPAKIFMGTSGAMFIGFLLAVVSVFSGAKLATVALVLTIPILDAVWVIIRRVRKNSSIFAGDKKNHLHYRLLELGFSQNKIVFFYYILSILFGIIALKLGGLGKFIAFIIFTSLVILFVNLIENYYINNAKVQMTNAKSNLKLK
ncbi:undecaprenyl/decaprenyl-phosphate alpha-N-acetylglucosaminyl 1-phosphate transferase [Patescibacteria group bacterium]|nr:undecaprenyl/decaprenyl-phosphate alpha-N-acetylglucosaminyl 1-phosphate transferase [Patescibacteria group bacterium]MBU4579672.1 undecaprenyl/decaprenyl-phosphate alpha-N-acetylglucosaminyl 1-phosphate transferase [Patescibacteria group bacterium]